MNQEQDTIINKREQKIIARQMQQKDYYATKGKHVRQAYYQANIEEKRKASREYQRSRRKLLKEYERIALATLVS